MEEINYWKHLYDTISNQTNQTKASEDICIIPYMDVIAFCLSFSSLAIAIGQIWYKNRIVHLTPDIMEEIVGISERKGYN